jgi:hypothetical protein
VGFLSLENLDIPIALQPRRLRAFGEPRPAPRAHALPRTDTPHRHTHTHTHTHTNRRAIGQWSPKAQSQLAMVGAMQKSYFAGLPLSRPPSPPPSRHGILGNRDASTITPTNAVPAVTRKFARIPLQSTNSPPKAADPLQPKTRTFSTAAHLPGGYNKKGRHTKHYCVRRCIGHVCNKGPVVEITLVMLSLTSVLLRYVIHQNTLYQSCK